MKKSIFYFVFFAILFIGCNKGSNPSEPVGSNWTQGQGLVGYSVSGFGVSGGNLLVGASHFPLPYAYIFLSTDNGSTWKLQYSFHVDNTIPLTSLIFTPNISFINDGTMLLAGTWSLPRGAIYRSTDNGFTWSDNNVNWPENDSDLTENINCFCVAGGEIFAGTSHGIFVSTNHGTSWVASNTGLYDSTTKKGHPISGLASIASNIFACTYGEGIFRSTNGGVNWIQVNMTNFDFQGLVTMGTNIFAGAFNDLGSPSTGGVFVSTNNGDSWLHSDVGLVDHGVNVVYANSLYLIAGTDTSIFVTNNEGSTWQNISTGRPLEGGVSGATALYIYNSYLFANSGGSVWRYPVSLLP